MELNLPNLIRENVNLRQALRAQEGGIMKYWAEHPDTDGKEDLFKNYRKKCVDDFRKVNKWNLNINLSGNNLELKALGYDHMEKELDFLVALEPILTNIKMSDASEDICNFVDSYLTFAFTERRRLDYPNGMSLAEYYREIINMYSLSGYAYQCMNLILKEHHGIAKTQYDLYTEFYIRQNYNFFLGRNDEFVKLRMAVAEMLDEKDSEECRRTAIATMKNVRSFSQKIYNKGYVQYLRDVKYPADDKAYFVKTKNEKGVGKHLNIDSFLEGAEELESNGKWLREQMGKAKVPIFPINSMLSIFTQFVFVLMEIGRIWAARLLRYHHIDMHELEKETNCILKPLSKLDRPEHDDKNLLYYVDKYHSDDLPTDCCVYDEGQAKELLEKIKHDDDDVDTKRKAILEYVGRLKNVVEEKYATVYDEMWQNILENKSVKSKVYEKGKHQDTIFNRSLVDNVIKLMNDNGIFKVGTNPTNMASILDPEKGKDSPIRGTVGSSPTDKSMRKNVEDVIVEFQNKTKANK